MPHDVEVTVDPLLCVGSGTCVGLAPELFELDADGVARPLSTPVPDGDELREAQECCPVQAIRVRDTETSTG